MESGSFTLLIVVFRKTFDPLRFASPLHLRKHGHMGADDRLFWLDLEMSGLDPRQDKILEAAAVVTNFKLVPLETYETAVYQPSEVLAKMNDWCRQHHGASGLTSRVPGGISEAALDDSLCALADRYSLGNNITLAGNSISHDRRFIDSWLPRFSQRPHYRMVDVTSFKLVFENLFGIPYPKRNHHRALEDIQESIAELRYYIGAIDPSRMRVL